MNCLFVQLLLDSSALNNRMAFSIRAPTTRVQGRRIVARNARAAHPVQAVNVSAAPAPAFARFGAPAPRQTARKVACAAAMAKKSVGDLSKAELEVRDHLLGEGLKCEHGACYVPDGVGPPSR
jgi:hypothetical protein